MEVFWGLIVYAEPILVIVLVSVIFVVSLWLSGFLVETEVPILRALTKDQVLAFFDKYFGPESPERRRLCTMVYAETGAADDQNSKAQRRKRESKDAVSLKIFICRTVVVDFLHFSAPVLWRFWTLRVYSYFSLHFHILVYFRF